MSNKKTNLKILILTVLACVVVMAFILTNKTTSSTNQNDNIGCKINNLINPKDEIKNSPWNGKWVMKDSSNFSFSKAEISHATNNKFYFHMDAQNGINIGSMDNYVQSDNCVAGDMLIDGNTATFTDHPYDDQEECIMTFTLSDDQKTLTIKGGNGTLKGCDEYSFGHGVYADGEYQKGLEVKQIGIKDSQIFTDYPQAYGVFTKLVGKYLELFDGTAMFQDLDTYATSGAEVQVSGVAHEADIQNIIRVGKGNKIWAAVSDFDEEKNVPIIRYFTNVPGYENKMPEDLMKWYKDNYTGKFGTSTVVYIGGR